MRGKISDQDLTNYALNDGMEARERLYVESMLGLSDECREDVYRQLDVAQMLEEGFEAEDEMAPAMLTAEQREHLLNLPVQFAVGAFVRKTAAALALAASVALVLSHPHLWQGENRGMRMAAVSQEVTRMVEAMASDPESDYAAWVNPPTVSDDDTAAFIQTTGESLPVLAEETGCTPPSTGDYASTH